MAVETVSDEVVDVPKGVLLPESNGVLLPELNGMLLPEEVESVTDDTA